MRISTMAVFNPIALFIPLSSYLFFFNLIDMI